MKLSRAPQLQVRRRNEDGQVEPKILLENGNALSTLHKLLDHDSCEAGKAGGKNGEKGGKERDGKLLLTGLGNLDGGDTAGEKEEGGPLHRGEPGVIENNKDYCFFSTKTLANPTTTISRDPNTCWVMGESEMLITTKYKLFAIR